MEFLARFAPQKPKVLYCEAEDCMIGDVLRSEVSELGQCSEKRVDCLNTARGHQSEG